MKLRQNVICVLESILTIMEFGGHWWIQEAIYAFGIDVSGTGVVVYEESCLGRHRDW